MTCVNCVHGPSAYDVVRKCPKVNRFVRETDPACEHFERREYTGEQIRDCNCCERQTGE